MKALTFTQEEWKEKAESFAKEYLIPEEPILVIEYEEAGHRIQFWTETFAVELWQTVKTNIGTGAEEDVLEDETVFRNPTLPITM